MLLTFFLLWSFQGNSYFLDGHAFHLRSGVIVKTVADVKESSQFYTWQEGTSFITLEKRNVRHVEFFSLRVPGNRPKSTSRSATRRRISGIPVAFTNKQGETEIKTRHINQRGRSVEGQKVPNRVDRLTTKAEAHGAFYEVAFANYTVGSNVELRFYDLKGNLQAKAFLEVAEPNGQVHLQKNRDALVWNFSLSDQINVQKLGLVEVITLEDKP